MKPAPAISTFVTCGEAGSSRTIALRQHARRARPRPWPAAARCCEAKSPWPASRVRSTTDRGGIDRRRQHLALQARERPARATAPVPASSPQPAAAFKRPASLPVRTLPADPRPATSAARAARAAPRPPAARLRGTGAGRALGGFHQQLRVVATGATLHGGRPGPTQATPGRLPASCARRRAGSRARRRRACPRHAAAQGGRRAASAATSRSCSAAAAKPA